MSRSQTKLTDEQRRVVEANLGLVGYVLNRTVKFGLLYSEDAFQVGLMGLMYAAATFDPARNNRFSSYAVACILNEVRNEHRKYRAEKRGGHVKTVSLDAPVGGIMDKNGILLDDVADPSPPIADVVVDEESERFVRKALRRVYPRHADLLEDYLLTDMNQKQIADKHGCTQASVSFHVRSGLRLLRRYLRGVGYGQ